MSQHAASNVHKEDVLQEHLIQNLIEGQGYERRVGSEKSRAYQGDVHFDKSLAMDRGLVVRFLKDSQPASWAKLEQHYAASAEDVLFRRTTAPLPSLFHAPGYRGKIHPRRAPELHDL